MFKHYKTIGKAIAEMTFGRKYYINIINTRGTDRYEASCFIFTSYDDAKRHADALSTNRSYAHVETISFRSRYIYPIKP